MENNLEKIKKDYKYSCYFWKIYGTVLFIVLIMIFFYPFLFRTLYGTEITVGENKIILPRRFFFIKDEEILNSGVKQIAKVYLKYSVWSAVIVYDISKINYKRSKKNWIKNNKCYLQTKNWKNYEIDEILFTSPDFKESEFVMISIPELKLLFTFYDYRIMKIFMENIDINTTSENSRDSRTSLKMEKMSEKNGKILLHKFRKKYE